MGGYGSVGPVRPVESGVRGARFSFCVLVAALTGCTGLEPGVIGVGMTAVQQGVTYVSGVDSYSFQPAYYDDVLVAADRAGEALGLEVYSKREISPTQTEIRFRFDKDDRLTVRIAHQTDTITLVQTNVKRKSRQGIATLFMRALTHGLRDGGGYVGDWMVEADLIGE